MERELKYPFNLYLKKEPEIAAFIGIKENKFICGEGKNDEPSIEVRRSRDR